MAFFYKVVVPSGNTYTVTYHSNVTGIDDIEVVYNEGDDVTVAENTFTNPGYAFTEWTTEEDGSGYSYSPGDVIEDIDDDIDLYAQWEESDDLTLTFPLNSNPGGWPTTNSTTLTNYPYTLNNVVYTFALMNVKCNSGYLMMTATAVLGLPALEGYKLTKVVASNSSQCSTSTKVGISSSATQASYIDGGATQTWSTQSSTYTYNLTSTEENTMYYMYVTDKNAQVIGVELTYEAVAATSVATPTISLASGTYHANQSVTLSCTTEGASIYYTLDGNDPTSSSTPYTDAITIDRHRVLKAIAILDEASSNVASAEYMLTPESPVFSPVAGTYVGEQTVTITCATTGATLFYKFSGDAEWTVYNDPVTVSQSTTLCTKASMGYWEDAQECADYVIEQPLSTMDEIFAAAGSTATSHNIAFNNWVVTGVSSNGKNVFVTDGTKGFVINNSDGGLGTTYHKGDHITGTTTASLKLNQGYAQLTNVDADDLTITSGADPEIAEIEMADLMGINTGALVHYDNLVCSVQSGNYTNYYLSDGETTIQVYGSIYSFGTTLEANKHYNITGVYQQYGNTKEVLPRDADDIVEVVPSTPYINLETYLIETIASAFDGSYDITYGNLEIQGVDDFTIQFYSDAQGTTAIEHPDWIITNEVTTYQEGYRLHIATSINLGDARTTYLKVSVGNTSSDLVTITQAAPVIDYATLPFTYDGNGTGTLPAGFTVSGLGTFSSSPAMKFDGVGDNAVLKINEHPGTLSFDIKGTGTGTWSGTFLVQASADGTNYSNIATYTTLGDTETKTINNLAADVRYIRWYFSEKTQGYNVALGNINLAAYVAPTQYTLTVTFGEHVEAIYVFNTADETEALIENGAPGTVQVLEGTSIEVSPDADNGYMISSLLINNEDVFSQMVSGSYTFTMTGDVTITATAVEYVEPHYINFFVNGEEFEEAEMAITPGQSLGELPVPSENIPEGFTFVGWMEWPDHPYYNATTAPEMVSSTTVPEDDMILDAVFYISETAQGTYVLSNAAPTDGDWVVLAVNVSGTYYAMNGPAVEALDVANNTIVGTPDAAFEAKKLTQNDTDYIGLTQDGTQYVHLNTSAIKIANGTSNGFLEFTQSGTGYLVSTTVDYQGSDVTRYINYNGSGFTVTTDDEEASTLYVFKYIPGATTNMDYTTSVTVHESGYIANNQAETLYGIHYIDGYVFAGDEVTNSGKLVVNNEGTLDMYGSKLVNTEVANFVIKDGGQYKGDEVLATVEKVILPYTPGVKNNWYAISMPFNYGINPGIDGYMTEMVTDNDNELTYDFYRFDNSYPNAEWRNHRLNDGFGMTVGQGYLYAHKKGITLNFTGTLNATDENIQSVGFYNATNYQNAYPFADWFFAGNPFPCSATIVGFEDFYVMNEAGSNFVLSEDGVLNPLQGAMIYDAEAPTGNGYTITYQVQGMSKSNNGNETDKGMINLSISQDNELVDMARVRFGEGSMLGKFNFNENATKLYIPQGKKDYAVVRAQSEGEMPVSFKATKSGIYTFSVEPKNVEMAYLHLIDNKTGADVDLLATPSYTFEASNDDYESRFRLVFNANNGSNENGNETFAYYNGSEWVINNPSTGSGDNATLQVVDMMGRVLSSETLNGNANVTLNQAAGIYMLRLVNGENVKVQKVVVR